MKEPEQHDAHVLAFKIHKPTARQIRAVVADEFDFDVSVMWVADRRQPCFRARQAAAKLIREIHPRYTLMRISTSLGNRDHTSILHMLRKPLRPEDEPKIAAARARLLRGPEPLPSIPEPPPVPPRTRGVQFLPYLTDKGFWHCEIRGPKGAHRIFSLGTRDEREARIKVEAMR